MGQGRQLGSWVFLLPLVEMNKMQHIPREQTTLAAEVCKHKRIGGITTSIVR